MVVRFAAVAVALFAFASGAMGASPAQQCSQGKLAEASKKAERQLKCQAINARLGGVDQFCMEKASNRFTLSWNRIEARGGCLTTGDRDSIEAKIDAFVDDVTTELRPILNPNKCTALKLRAAGRKARGKLVCHARVAKQSGATDPLCLLREEARFSVRWQKAEASSFCLTSGDEDAIEAKVDAFVNDIATLLPKPSTTTSSTETTSTTVESSTSSSTSTTVEPSTTSSSVTTPTSSTTSTTIPASASAAFL
jgi:hypothetical protein